MNRCRKHWLQFSGAGAIAMLMASWALLWRSPTMTLDEVQAVLGRDAAEAEQLLDQYLKRYPEDSRAHLMLAGVLVARNDLSGGLQHLDRVSDSSQWSIEARFREGSLERQRNRAQAAERAWLRCLRADEATQTGATEIAHEAVVQLVVLYSLQGRQSELQQVLWAWHARLPRPQRIRALIALLNVQFGSAPAAETAIAELAKFVQADPRDYESRRALGRMLVAQPGQSATGRKLLEACLSAQPTNVQSLAAYLEGLIALEDLPAARVSIARLPDPADDSAELWHLRGSIHQLSEDWDQAADAFQQALHKNPSNYEVHARMADTLRRLGRDDAADVHERSSQEFFTVEQQLRSVNDLFQATEGLLDRMDTLSAFTVGELYERAGRAREARAWYDETLQRDPQHADAHAAFDRLGAIE